MQTNVSIFSEANGISFRTIDQTVINVPKPAPSAMTRTGFGMRIFRIYEWLSSQTICPSQLRLVGLAQSLISQPPPVEVPVVRSFSSPPTQCQTIKPML